jgi:predicted dehydrogenase
MPATPVKRIRLALIGAGIFMRDAHLPALLRLSDRFEIVAVHSRTPESTAALIERIGASVEPIADVDALLARADIDAVDMVLPIPAQAAVLAQVLASGKHVISEKPIAPDNATARALIELQRQHPAQVWMVAENWRYEEAYVRYVRGWSDGRLPCTGLSIRR